MILTSIVVNLIINLRTNNPPVLQELFTNFNNITIMNIRFGIQVYCLSAIKFILNNKYGTSIDNPMTEIDRIVIYKDHLHIEYKGNEYEIQYSELDYDE